MARRGGDPRWITARHPGRCVRCGKPFPKGAAVFWYPASKTVYANGCADDAAGEFEACRQDEDIFVNASL